MIEFKNVYYSYNNAGFGVNNLNLKIDTNEILGVVGRSGCGKSTFANIVAGIIKPNSGKVYVFGKDITNQNDITPRTSIVFQTPEVQLLENTVYEDIAFGPKNQGKSKQEIEKIVHEAAKLMNIDKNLLNRSPFLLSGGEKHKCAIAGAIALKPKILILDEPTAGLDGYARKSLIESLKAYHKQAKCIIIFISHFIEEIAEISDKILVMNNGEKFLHGPTKNILCMYKELKQIGLDVPQIEKVTRVLNNKLNNKDLSNVAITLDEAKDKVLKILKSGDDDTDFRF